MIPNPFRQKAYAGLTASLVVICIVVVVVGLLVSSRFRAHNSTALAPDPNSAIDSAIPAASSLHQHDGDLKINTSNVRVERIHITGDLIIDAPATNVVVSDTVVDGQVFINGDTPSKKIDNKLVGIVPENIKLERVDMHGLSTLGFDDLTIDSCSIHGIASTLAQVSRSQNEYQGNSLVWPATNFTLTRSHLYGIQPSDGKGGHFEAIHLLGVKGFLLSYNVFDARVKDQATFNQITQALTMEKDFGGVSSSDGVIKGNTFYGGGVYQVGFYMTCTSPSSCQVVDNRFTTYRDPNGTLHDAVQYPPSPGDPSFEQAGNTLDGRPFTLLTGAD